MNYIFLADFLELIGGILIAFTVISVHKKILHDHRLDDSVFSTIRREQVLAVVIPLIAIQMLVGNFLEPRLMGRSFNLSALAILFSLSIWGAIWGVTGMIICVPFMVILSIIMSNFPQTRTYAVWLSQNGELDSE